MIVMMVVAVMRMRMMRMVVMVRNYGDDDDLDNDIAKKVKANVLHRPV